MRTHLSRWAASAGLAALLAASPLQAQTSTSGSSEGPPAISIDSAGSAFHDHIPLLEREMPWPSFWGNAGGAADQGGDPTDDMPMPVPAGSAGHGMAMQHGGSHP